MAKGEKPAAERARMYARRMPAKFLHFLREASPGLFANFCLSILIVIRPVSSWVGRFSFLSVAYLHLFFYPAATLTIGAQIETVVLCTLGAAIGLGLSFLAVWGAIELHGDQTTSAYLTHDSRAVVGVALSVIAFATAFIQSSLPRLRQPARIALFDAIWCLTAQHTVLSGSIFLELFIPALFAAVVSLIASFLFFPQTSNRTLAVLLVRQLDELDQAITKGVQAFLLKDHKAAKESTALQEEMLSRLSQIRSRFRETTYELTYSRVRTQEYQRMVPVLEHMQGWISCGFPLHKLKVIVEDPPASSMTATSSAEASSSDESSQEGQEQEQERERPEAPISKDSETVASLKPIMVSLLEAIRASLRIARDNTELTLGYHLSKDRDGRWTTKIVASSLLGLFGDVSSEEKASAIAERGFLACRMKLNQTIDAAKANLKTCTLHLVDPFLSEFAHTSATVGNEKKGTEAAEVTYASGLLVTSLLELAQECATLLRLSQAHLHMRRSQPHRRLQLPALSIGTWLGSEEGRRDNLYTLISDRSMLHRTVSRNSGTAAEGAEVDAELDELYAHNAQVTPTGAGVPTAHAHSSRTAQVEEPLHFWHAATRRPVVMRVRFVVSRVVRWVRHSKDLRFALKMAVGLALLTLPAWLPGSPRGWFLDNRAQCEWGGSCRLYITTSFRRLTPPCSQGSLSRTHGSSRHPTLQLSKPASGVCE